MDKLKFNKSEPSTHEVEIERVLSVMRDLSPTDKVYVEVLDQYVKLKKLQTEIDSKQRPTTDTMVTAATNLIGIVVILKHEWAHVIGTRAMSFVKSIR